MSECYLIGIGGTGSKIVENYIKLCTTGLGPTNLWLGMVDQDEANGNVARAKASIENYQRLRSFIKREGKNNIGYETSFLKTDIKTHPEDSSWCPLPGVTPTLKEVFSYDLLNSSLKDSIDCLYHTEDELNLPLDEGFRARPSIGAAAILSQMNSDTPFWQRLFDALDEANSGKDIRIFLVSSIFGGTGASGFPSIARLLREIIKEKNITSGVKIGGALMLPYFNFPKPEADEEKQVAHADTFLEQSRGALDYYSRMFDNSDDKTFDELYIAGADPLIPLKYFEKGGNNQKNPPLMPEIYACLAASKFFESETIDESKIFHISRKNNLTFNWHDLPAVRENKMEVRNLIGQFTRTAIAFKEIYYPFLTTKWKNIQNESWFKILIRNENVDLSDDEMQYEIDRIKIFFDDFLEWLASLNFNSKAFENEKISLVKCEHFASLDNSNKFGMVNLHEKLNKFQLSIFDDLIEGTKSKNLAKVFVDMNYPKHHSNRTGFGQFLGQLYDSCQSLDKGRSDD